MDSILERIDGWLIALVFAATMFACWGFGYRRGCREPLEVGEDPGNKFIDASIALVGLLLAFTFAMALGRHDQRRLAVVAESNAIGDFYTCASLLKEPEKSQLQKVIRVYARHILDTPQERLPVEEEKKAVQRSQELVAHMTRLVGEALAVGTPIAMPLTNTLNNVTSTNASRLHTYQERLPWSIVLLLYLSSVVPSYLIGEKQGCSHKKHLAGSLSFIVLVSLVIFITLDLNQPRRGLIQVSQQALETLVRSMDQ
jgi:membrane protease YdiL (CAAX protease family)